MDPNPVSVAAAVAVGGVPLAWIVVANTARGRRERARARIRKADPRAAAPTGGEVSAEELGTLGRLREAGGISDEDAQKIERDLLGSS